MGLGTAHFLADLVGLLDIHLVKHSLVRPSSFRRLSCYDGATTEMGTGPRGTLIQHCAGGYRSEAGGMFLMIHVGLRAHLAILWKFGDANGRLFLVLLLAYLVVICVAGAWLFWATWSGLLPFEVFVSFALAVSTGPAFASPLLGPMYSSPFVSPLLGRGWNTAKK